MQIQSHPLSSNKSEALSKWIDLPAFDILVEVLEQGRFDLQIEASKLREEEPDTGFHVKAAALEHQCRMIAQNIASLKLIRTQKEFSVSTASSEL